MNNRIKEQSWLTWLTTCLLLLLSACDGQDNREPATGNEVSTPGEEIVSVNPMEGLNTTLFVSEEERSEWIRSVKGIIDGVSLYTSFRIDSEYGTSHYFLSVDPRSVERTEGMEIPAQYYEVPSAGGKFTIEGMAKTPLTPLKVSDWIDGIYVFETIGVDATPEDYNLPPFFDYGSMTEEQRHLMPTLGVMTSETGLKDGKACFEIPVNESGNTRSIILEWSYWDDYSYTATNIIGPYQASASLEIVQRP